jgi:hypothetical protein
MLEVMPDRHSRGRVRGVEKVCDSPWPSSGLPGEGGSLRHWLLWRGDSPTAFRLVAGGRNSINVNDGVGGRSLLVPFAALVTLIEGARRVGIFEGEVEWLLLLAYTVHTKVI